MLGRQDVQFTHELTGPEPREDLLRCPVGPLVHDFDDGIVGKEQVNCRIAGLKKLLPQFDWFGLAERVDASALLCR
jgi:hypothetical protein